MRIIKLTESDLNRLVKKVIKEEESPNYMFFSNLEQMKRQCELLLQLDPNMVDEILMNGHDWADDHISSAKENIDQVFDFMMNETKKDETTHQDSIMSESEKQKKNVPTNPALWKKSLAWAKTKYKVCPSAYCNGGAAKHYKSLGGKWKKK